VSHKSDLPAAVSLSTRVYAALLVLYPAAYRREFGADMVQLFRDVSRETYYGRRVMGMLHWWISTIVDLIFTAFEQRKESRMTMSRSLSLQPMKGSGLGLMCISGGIIYLVGGCWLAISGVPGDLMGIQFTNLLRMMWAGGATCGLMGMCVTGAIDKSRVARAAAWLSGIGFAIIVADALVALVIRSPMSTFSTSPLPFSNLVEVIPLAGWSVLSILLLNSKEWSGWSQFAPLAMLLAPFVGLLLGALVGNSLLTIEVMGLALVMLGLATKRHLEALGPVTSRA
jgi:hypothetical protein